jgi:hypothetical protein
MGGKLAWWGGKLVPWSEVVRGGERGRLGEVWGIRCPVVPAGWCWVRQVGWHGVVLVTHMCLQ